MYKYACLNPIASVGLNKFTVDYVKTEDVNEAEGILVRSASMHEMDFSDNLLCVARAGAGVNNIPLEECAKKGIVVFNTPAVSFNSFSISFLDKSTYSLKSLSKFGKL